MKVKTLETTAGPLEVREIEMESLVLPQVGISGFKSFEDMGHIFGEVEEEAFLVAHLYDGYGYIYLNDKILSYPRGEE